MGVERARRRISKRWASADGCAAGVAPAAEVSLGGDDERRSWLLEQGREDRLAYDRYLSSMDASHAPEGGASPLPSCSDAGAWRTWEWDRARAATRSPGSTPSSR